MHHEQTESTPARPEPDKALAVRIETEIEGRMRSRIYDLHVHCSGDALILRGQSRTYYAKQLAQEAALDLAGGAIPVINQIVVC